MNPDFLQWSGAITGVAGSALLAWNHRLSPYGFVIYLASNGFWLAYGVVTNAWGMVAMQGVFTVLNLVAIHRWILRKPEPVLA
jgi:hypothetical protein